jgi:hypothetical protein
LDVHVADAGGLENTLGGGENVARIGDMGSHFQFQVADVVITAQSPEVRLLDGQNSWQTGSLEKEKTEILLPEGSIKQTEKERKKRNLTKNYPLYTARENIFERVWSSLHQDVD